MAPAANLCAAAVGTETDGSIVCPAGNNLVVGLKPTIGLYQPVRDHPHRAQPGHRRPDGAHGHGRRRAPERAQARRWDRSPASRCPADYTAFLNPNALQGARIGIERRQFLPEYFALPEINAVVEDAIEAMAAAGATIVDPVDTGDTFAWFDAEFTVLLYEFKGDIAAYLSGLRFGPRANAHAHPGRPHRLQPGHCTEEMKFFGQEIFESAESLSGNLNDPEYIAARQLCLQLTRDDGIDRVMAEHTSTRSLSPSYAFGSSAPAAAGYPIISVPVGLAADGKPAGAWLYAGFLQEPKLIAIAYAMEQLLQPRSPAQFAGSKPPDPPDAGLCLVPQATARGRGRDDSVRAMHPATGRRIRRVQ